MSPGVPVPASSAVEAPIAALCPSIQAGGLAAARSTSASPSSCQFHPTCALRSGRSQAADIPDSARPDLEDLDGLEVRPESWDWSLDMVHATGGIRTSFTVTEGGASFPRRTGRGPRPRRSAIAYYESPLGTGQAGAGTRGARRRVLLLVVDGQLRVGGQFEASVRARLRGTNQQHHQDSSHWFAEQLGGVAANG